MQSRSQARIVFLSRDPVVHEQSGSTTYILGLLCLLRARGAEVTLVATSAFSRSPRLFFRVVAPLPHGVHLRFPGYLRLGPWYVLPFRALAWARFLTRAAARWRWLRPVQRLEKLYGASLYTGAWDLTLPTLAEGDVAAREVEAAQATTVVANYCHWGPLLHESRFGSCRTAILMHDLLSARVRRFQESGTPLDMPPVTEAEELRWLAGADTVLTAQEREAEAIRERVRAKVMVTPMTLRARALPGEAVQAGRCLFVGSNIAPNQKGLAFLLQSVWPRVRAAVPGATLAVAGTVTRALAEGGRGELASLGVEPLGMVPSLETEYARAAVCLVPLLLGTGIKIKLVEALSFGKAVVSTSVGVQGLESWAEQAIAVADDAEPFAAAVVQLLQDEALRRDRERAALYWAERQFGPERPLDPDFIAALL